MNITYTPVSYTHLAAAAADHDDVLISRVLRLLRAAVHGKPFRLRQNDVVLEIRVYVGLYIFGVSPSGRAVLLSLIHI